MEQSVYKIGEVSARLGLVDKNNNTLRSWTEEFGQFLSALANPTAGQPRRFTEHDVRVLSAVRDYRANHLSYDEIRERLHAGEHNVTLPHVDAAPDVQPERVVVSTQALAPAQIESLLAPLAASVDEWRRLTEEYRRRLEGREERIEILEQRLDELYARLESAQQAAPAPGASPATADEAVPAPLTPGEKGDGVAAPAEDAVAGQPVADALFPLPIVERQPSSAATANGTHPTPERRAWWRVWRHG